MYLIDFLHLVVNVTTCKKYGGKLQTLYLLTQSF